MALGQVGVVHVGGRKGGRDGRGRVVLGIGQGGGLDPREGRRVVDRRHTDIASHGVGIGGAVVDRETHRPRQVDGVCAGILVRDCPQRRLVVGDGGAARSGSTCLWLHPRCR